jgi:solute carrier family 27 (fatty acid transporter), member 1/4
METRLEYAPMWLGLSKVGIVTALINTNLRKETLIHSIKTASSKAVIVSAELLDAVREIIHDEEMAKLDIYVYDNQSENVAKISEKNVDLHRELEKTSCESFDISTVQPKDKLFYIYTSGTTGEIFVNEL